MQVLRVAMLQHKRMEKNKVDETAGHADHEHATQPPLECYFDRW
jgi:hypothetical protein